MTLPASVFKCQVKKANSASLFKDSQKINKDRTHLQPQTSVETVRRLQADPVQKTGKGTDIPVSMHQAMNACR
jgi:hypothetical protein